LPHFQIDHSVPVWCCVVSSHPARPTRRDRSDELWSPWAQTRCPSDGWCGSDVFNYSFIKTSCSHLFFNNKQKVKLIVYKIYLEQKSERFMKTFCTWSTLIVGILNCCNCKHYYTLYMYWFCRFSKRNIYLPEICSNLPTLGPGFTITLQVLNSAGLSAIR